MNFAKLNVVYMEYLFSIIVAIYNTEPFLDDCINSVINQDLDFEDNVQLILVNDGSTDCSLDIALKYQDSYPNNIIVLSKENEGTASARNLGLKHATGKFVNFLDSDDLLSENALSAVKDFFSEHDVNIASIPLQFIGSKQRRHKLDVKFNKTKIINVYEDYGYPQLSISSSFIKKSIMDELCFDERVKIGEDALLFNQLLVNEGEYGLISKTEYLYRKRADRSSLMDTIRFEKEFFLNKLQYFYQKLIDYSIETKGYVPDFVKYALIYDIAGYYKVATSNVLNRQEFLEFRKSLKEVLNNFDDEMILNHDFISNDHKSFLIYLKNDEFHVDADSDNNAVYLKSNDYTINNLHHHKMYFDIVEIKDDMLNFTVYFNSACDYDYLTIEAVKVKDNKEEVYNGAFFDYPTTNRCPKESIGVCFKYPLTLDFKIPLDKPETSKIYFRIVYEENNQKIVMHNPVEFKHYASFSKVNNYLINDSQMLIYSDDDNSFYLRPYSFNAMLKLELVSILKLIKYFNSDSIRSIFWHIVFLLFYPFQRHKRIWLFQGREDVEDDNAKQLFIHSIKQNDEIKKYYVSSKHGDDYKAMKSIDKNIVPINSFKNKFLYLFAEKIISSRVNHKWLNPFHNHKHPYNNGYLTVQKCFLQNGVIKEDLSNRFRKFYQNLHLFLTSSDYERDFIRGDNFNYDDEVVQAFGLPKYDNLEFDVAKKEILVYSIWRRPLINEAFFIKSDYYSRLNSFLNNERLLRAAEKHGYKIVFRPPDEIIPFLDSFTIKPEVEVNIHDSDYAIFKNSAVLITDYSSVCFEFSFLKKPVIYYQHENDAHQEDGYFDYETMGFGDVIDNEESLVDKVIEYMENDCVMEEKYKERADDFFKYNDQKNSARIYDWLYNH